jgi:purine-binding chemotaxis protein CheW
MEREFAPSADVSTNGSSGSVGDGTAAKYLTFRLSKEQYAIDIMQVTEIIGMTDVTRVPNCPPHVLGVINLRGKIIPLVDLRLRFGMPKAAYDEKTCIIVTTVKTAEQKIVVGMVVDTVLEVALISNVCRTPEYGVSLDTSYVKGIAHLSSGDIAIVLDVDKALGNGDIPAPK